VGGVGVTFFLSTEMSFSLWAFVVILAIIEMIGKNFQYPIHEHFKDHQVGAYIAYAAVIVWVARRHLARAFRSIWRGPTRADGQDQLSERSAAIGFVLCFVVAGVWLALAGLPPHGAVVVTLIIFMLALALVLAGAAQLRIVYGRGATLTDDHAGKLLPERTYNSSADFANLLQQSPEKIRTERSRHASRVATGAAVVLALCFLRYRFLAWPLHPIGFIVAHTYPMQIFWLSIMIGWLCKTLVMRLGGVPVYRKLCPAFLGMIVGTTFSSIFWTLVKIASYSGGEEGKRILFLPS